MTEINDNTQELNSRKQTDNPKQTDHLNQTDNLRKAANLQGENISKLFTIIGTAELRVFLPLIPILLLLALILCLQSAEKKAPEIIETEAETQIEIETEISREELERIELNERIDQELAQYKNLGLVNTDGFINLRSEPDANNMKNIIGLLNDKAAFELLEDLGEWYYVRSGGLEGYLASRYCATGEDALKLARDNMCDRLIIKGESLNIRSAPDTSSETVVGKALKGERYKIVSSDGVWALVECKYINGTDTPYINCLPEYSEIRFCLDEARNRDLREMALTQFDNMIVCKTDGFVNIRKETTTSDANNVIGKIYKGNGADLLSEVSTEESKDGKTWYKIHSGSVTGYVRAYSDDAAPYFALGKEAQQLALNYADLTARIKVDNLNVRSEPNTDAKVWEQVTSGQAYKVLDQLDGWVQIDLDSADNDKAYISTQNGYVELRYGLEEAIQFSRAEKASKFRQQICDYGCQFIGNPYVWGGTSLTNGCDCSGFVQSVLKHYGIYIERTSYDQAKEGVKRTSDTMRPGDLVFYANSSGTINHVGMYIGGGYIVNAASRRAGIKVYKWNYRKPVAIRDVIGDRIE